MKVLLYTEGEKVVGKSGLGKAIKHQMKALSENKIEYIILYSFCAFKSRDICLKMFQILLYK